MKITVNEIFKSFQGEGITAGRPAIFIRLMGCDLKCSWCDTKYTWHPDYLEKRESVDVKDFTEAFIEMHLTDKDNRIIITGGEPMLQRKAIVEFIQRIWSAAKRNIIFEIETNGNHYPFGNEKMINMIEHWNISPKLGTSGNPEKERFIYNSLRHYNFMDNTTFKFVITDPIDVAEIKDKYNFLKPEKIWLMPEGTNSDDQLSKLKWVADCCKENGWNFMPRLQILTYQNQRGV